MPSSHLLHSSTLLKKIDVYLLPMALLAMNSCLELLFFIIIETETDSMIVTYCQNPIAILLTVNHILVIDST